MPDEMRQQIIVTIQDALAHEALPRNFTEQFERELAFWESVKSSDE
jgi:hypothetical protein